MEVEVGPELVDLLVLPSSHSGTGVWGGIETGFAVLVVGVIKLVSVLELVLTCVFIIYIQQGLELRLIDFEK